jgi:hypothetical protein
VRRIVDDPSRSGAITFRLDGSLGRSGGAAPEYGVVLQRQAVASAQIRVVRGALEVFEQVRRDELMDRHVQIVPFARGSTKDEMR